jgi:UDP-N-acetylmuramyl tripeptide synthase
VRDYVARLSAADDNRRPDRWPRTEERIDDHTHKTSSMTTLRDRAALAAARGAAAAIRVTGSGRGSTLPGKLANLVSADFLRDRAAELAEGFVLVTGTNGKTTTAAMAAHALRAHGRPLVHNVEGANLLSGIASAFASQRRAPFAVLEADEAIVPRAVAALGTPRVVVLTNLFRDQLDRYGEVDRLAEGWLGALRPLEHTSLVANADDPLVAHVALSSGLPTLFFGIEPDETTAVVPDREVSDAVVCPACGGLLAYRRRWLSQFGDYSCGRCDFARPGRDLAATELRLAAGGVDGAVRSSRAPVERLELSLAVPGLHSVYNALGAAALVGRLGIGLAAALADLATYRPVFGRASSYVYRGTTVRVSLVKNPAGMNQTLRTLAAVPGDRALVFVLNDNVADGRDISWIWDADLESLLPAARTVVACGRREAGMALRLKYAGVPEEALFATGRLEDALAVALGRSHDEIDVLPTYTALEEVRVTLAAERRAG